jgi:hypothetical protein
MIGGETDKPVCALSTFQPSSVGLTHHTLAIIIDPLAEIINVEPIRTWL